MFGNRKVRRSGRVKATRQGLRPMIEAFERRELLTAAPFLQGTAFIDTVGNGIRTTAELPLANATLKLYQGTTIAPANLVGTTTTGADGGYQFDSTNVNTSSANPGLVAGQTYSIVESAVGYVNTAAGATSQVDPYSITQPNVIQVTVEPPALTTTYLSDSLPYVAIYYSLTEGGTTYNSPASTITPDYFSTANGSTTLTSSYLSYCVDAGHGLDYPPESYGTATDPQSSLPDGGQIGYLFNHYGAPGTSATSFPSSIASDSITDLQAGLQLAIWDLEYNGGAATGAFNVTGGYGSVTSTELALDQSIANTLVADAAGKSEKVAVLDASTDGDPSNLNAPHSTANTQSVLAGESFNFGNIPTSNSSIAGIVYNDANGNDALNAGEAGLPNVVVTLSGTSITGATITPISTLTASDGGYSFPNLAPGTYTVTETPPAGYTVEAGNPGTTGGSGGIGSVGSIALGSNTASTANNLGQYKPASLAGIVYIDANGNDTLDAGDTGLGGITVTLTGTTGAGAAVKATAVTSGTGAYSFANLAPGTYTLTETQPTSYIAESANAGAVVGVVAVDGSSAVGSISTIVLSSGNAGVNDNFPELISKISGTVYLDPTGNGLTSANVPPVGSGDTPESGVTVILKNSGGAVIATTTTAADGTYSFNGEPLGTYTISEAPPSGQVQTGPNSLTYAITTTAPSPNSAGNNFSNYMACNMSGLSCVYYVVTTPCGVSKTVTDLRGNTAPGDTVTADFTVAAGSSAMLSLVSYSAPGSSFSASTASQQAIVGLQSGTFGPGAHSLTITVPNGYYQVDFVCGAPITTFGPAGSNVFYSNEGRLISADNGGTQPYALSSLSGTVFVDLNGNGTFGAGDAGLGNVTITLVGTTSTGLAVSIPATTSGTGAYSLTGIAPGVYKIVETLPSGYTTEVANVGTAGGTAAVGSVSSIALNSNTAAAGYNFGEVGTSITGTVYNDATGNGLCSTGAPLTGDTPEGGVKVSLIGAGNVVVATTTTAADGTYSFTGVPFGAYTVAEMVPSGQIQTGPSSLTNPAVISASSPNDPGNNFSNYAACNGSAIQNVSYRVNGCGPYSDLSGHTSQGSTVSATFTVTGSSNQMVSLVSYVVPYAGAPLSAQVEYSLATGTFTPGAHTISVTLPNGYYQVDFVCGAAISQFGPSGSNVTYHGEGRFISSDSGGCGVPSYCPPPLANVQTDIGAVGTPGTESYNNGTYTITGGGADIWNNADAFNYIYQALNGDGEIVARVDSISNTDPWAKAGVMIRQSLDPGSAQASVFATPGNGVVFQDREVSGGGSKSWSAGNNYGCGSSTPVFVKVVRLGNTVSGYDSSNGVTWTFIGSDTISLSQQVFIGLAVTSHNNGAVASATFDDVNTNGYWGGCAGQSLIQSSGGWTGSTSLSSFLAQCYPNLYGSNAGGNNLTGQNNNGVASFYLALEAQYGAESLECQTLAAALEEYFTCSQAGGQYGQKYGFDVNCYGFCSTTVSTSCDSDAFGGCGTIYVWQMLQDINNQSWGGFLYNGNSARHQEACGVVDTTTSCGY